MHCLQTQPRKPRLRNKISLGDYPKCNFNRCGNYSRCENYLRCVYHSRNEGNFRGDYFRFFREFSTLCRPKQMNYITKFHKLLIIKRMYRVSEALSNLNCQIVRTPEELNEVKRGLDGIKSFEFLH